MLTPAQILQLKAKIDATPAMNSQPMTNLGHIEVARLLNSDAVDKCWKTYTSKESIIEAIDWTKFTPADEVPSPDGTTANTNALLAFQDRGFVVSIKQLNLQMLIGASDYLRTGLQNIRDGLRDCLVALPTGVSGVNTNAGATTVVNAMTRFITEYENIYSVTTATTGGVTAKNLLVEGPVSLDDVATARELI